MGAQEDREEDESSVGHGEGKVPRASRLGDRSQFRAPKRPEVKGREILQWASHQPDLEGEVRRE